MHTSAGETACRAAVEAAREAAADAPALLGVTVLTSLSSRDLRQTGVADDLAGVVDRRARLAAAAGMHGVVCAASDQEVVAMAAPVLDRVIPGVRPGDAAAGDQARVATPFEAARGGATMVVVGRPITGAPDPAAVCEAIRRELSVASPSI